MSRSSQNPDHFTLAEAAQFLAQPLTARPSGPLATAPVEPPVNLPGGNPKPPKSSRLFQTSDHRAWFLPVPCEDAEHHHWRWDGQPYDEAGPMCVSVDAPSLRMPLTALASDPGFHSLSASHAGDDYLRPAVTS